MDWENKIILITGGSGSFRKKFIEIMLKEYKPSKLIVFSRDELKQHELQQMGFSHQNLRYFLGDERDYNRLRYAFDGVDYVVHAAALKQVPNCEYNPMKAVKTNILGSSNVIGAALDANVDRVVALSTDKAVNPINLYHSTKLVAEKLFIQGNAYAGGKRTRFSCVRYGNVVASRGSVVPLFIRQREMGEVTVTDERMTRNWISLEQGVRFVIRCLEEMHGGEVFVPKIPSMNVMDLAKAVAPQAKIDIIGIRPGEKLHEVLISEDEARTVVDLDDMYFVQPAEAPWFGREWGENRNPVSDDFRYASNTNQNWLTVPQIKEIIKPLEEADN